jgi:hypothetical protein
MNDEEKKVEITEENSNLFQKEVNECKTNE